MSKIKELAPVDEPAPIISNTVYQIPGPRKLRVARSTSAKHKEIAG